MQKSKIKNKSMLSVQLALQFVAEHKELFEEWVKKKYEKGMAKNN